MQSFVKNRNSLPQEKGVSNNQAVADELKVPVPRIGSSSKSRHGSRRGPDRLKGEPAEDLRTAGADEMYEFEQGTMFDNTDASVFDQMSTDFGENVNNTPASVVAGNGGSVTQQRTRDDGQAPNGDDNENNDLYDIADQDFAESVAGDVDMEALFQFKRQEAQANGFVDQYVKGDSYPDTTPGWPSEVDENEAQPNTIAVMPGFGQAQHPYWDVDRNRTAHATDTRRPVTKKPLDRRANTSQRVMAPVAERSLFERPDQIKYPSVDEERTPFTMQLAPNRARPVSGKAVAGGKRSSTLVERGVRNTGSPFNEHAKILSKQEQAAPAEAAQLTHRRVAFDTPLRRSTNAPTVAQRQAEVTNGNEHGVQQQDQDRHDRGEEETGLQEDDDDASNSRDEGELDEPHSMLDHELEKLYTMGFDTLTAESFDEDPTSASFEATGVRNEDSLAGKLEAVGKLDPATQARFFASLKLDEWEEGGDWFLDRFGSVIATLKESRQRKRQAARSFELELEKRHAAVGKKRERTDNALGEMRIHGTQVLTGTPKRLKA